MSPSILIFSMHRANYLRECLGFFPDHLSLSEPKNSSTFSSQLKLTRQLVSHIHAYKICHERLKDDVKPPLSKSLRKKHTENKCTFRI